MAFRFPQGSASSVISLAAGAIAASAVAFAWLPLLTESAQRELDNEARQLHALARIAKAEVAQHPDDGPHGQVMTSNHLKLSPHSPFH